MPFHSEQKSQFIAQSAIKKEKNDMKRIIAFAYGIVCYAVFLAALLYTIGFLGNFAVPKSIDSGAEGSTIVALAIDGGLLALFALQHSIMARPWFKRAWTRFVPEPVERSTYVLFSSAALLLLFCSGARSAASYGQWTAGSLKRSCLSRTSRGCRSFCSAHF